MSDESTTSRLLRLLSLLQTHRFWTGDELAKRLDVSGRTLRRDVERLRDLGYRLSSSRGPDGGYQLAAGADLPPLLLTNDEAVSLTVALRTAATRGPIVGLAETNVAVLAKLEQVLPSRLRGRVNALQAATVILEPVGDGVVVDPDVLVLLAFACRDNQRLRIGYTAGDGTETMRKVEPSALVPHRARWYLLCWDTGRTDWRTLRVDRVTSIEETGVRFESRPLPAPDAAEFVARQLQESPIHQADVIIHAGLADTSRYLAGHVQGLVADGPDRTRWHIEAERLETLAGALAWLPWSFEVIGSAQLTELLDTFARRLHEAVSGR